MSAPAKARTAPGGKEALRVPEATKLVIVASGGVWDWRLHNDHDAIVAVCPSRVGSPELLALQLCTVFDLVATPEHYAPRIRNGSLQTVESVSRARLFTIEFERPVIT